MTSFDVTSLLANVLVDFYHQSNSQLCFTQEQWAQRPIQKMSEEAAGLRKQLRFSLTVVFTDRLIAFYGLTYSTAHGWHIHELRCRLGLSDDTTGVSTRPTLPYVDDPFLLFPNWDSLNRFFTNINSIHRNIVFTKELETNNCLHFLDVSIEKPPTGFITSTYWKTMHTGLHSK